MAIPKHDDIRIPVLEVLKQKGEMKLRDFVEPLAKHFSLSEEEVDKI